MTTTPHVFRIDTIITHPGAAHRDDLLAVGLALLDTDYSRDGRPPWEHVEVYRRPATEADLDKSRVMVLDTGGRHQPGLCNFDHHQLPRDASPECALSLLAKYQGYISAFQLMPWWEFTVMLDAKGPVEAARLVGLDKLPPELESPVEAGLLAEFARYSGDTRVPPYVIRAMMLVAERALFSALDLEEAYAALDGGLETIDIEGESPHLPIRAILAEVQTSPETNQVLAEHKETLDRAEPEDGEIAISIMLSDREGESWVLYRYDDHPAVDFTRIADSPLTVFAHPGGFIAKLAEGASKDDAIELACAAVDE